MTERLKRREKMKKVILGSALAFFGLLMITGMMFGGRGHHRGMRGQQRQQFIQQYDNSIPQAPEASSAVPNAPDAPSFENDASNRGEFEGRHSHGRHSHGHRHGFGLFKLFPLILLLGGLAIYRKRTRTGSSEAAAEPTAKAEKGFSESKFDEYMKVDPDDGT